ncbi:MAG: RHS repeat-associated core domain-containing protein, partial [Rhodocyclaceae bacterium]
YTYDPVTFRLTRLQTLRGGENLQDLAYVYDPVGNITHIHDDAQQTVYFDNQVVAPHADYAYDALYRLLSAEGREHVGQATQPATSWDDAFRARLPHPHDGRAMRRYTERYQYDPVGNFLQLSHQAANGNWVRSYTYGETSQIEPEGMSNRLSSTRVGNGSAETYQYDAHGNMTNMPHLAAMAWNYRDQLQHVDLGGGGDAYYVYDASGQRARKVVERNGGTLIEERLYLGGFEIFRRRNAAGAITLERETLHVMDDKQRIALVDTRTLGDEADVPAQSVRYQFGNHLGSASLELDEAGRIVSYEEYYPYGSTSYQAGRSAAEVSLKRYRYSGKERDEETGFADHGARYYASWLGRWISADPIGIGDGPNLYGYCQANPVMLVDLAGTDSSPAIKDAQVTRTDEVHILNQDERYSEHRVTTYGEGWVAVDEHKEQKVAFIKETVTHESFDDPGASWSSSRTTQLPIEPEFRGRSRGKFEVFKVKRTQTVVSVRPAKKAQEGSGGKALSRVFGALQMVGGIFEAKFGAALCTTGIGCAVGVLLLAHGVDVMQSGARQLISGDRTRT